MSLILGVASYVTMPKLVMLFGCTENVYQYAADYGKIICLGAPFMIIYSSLSSVIKLLWSSDTQDPAASVNGFSQ